MPWCHRRIQDLKTFRPGEIPNPLTSAAPLSLMVSAMRVKSPFPKALCSDSFEQFLTAHWRQRAHRLPPFSIKIPIFSALSDVKEAAFLRISGAQVGG
jgi:hypothetical protein